MFHCGRLDILPVGDLGIRKGFQALYKLKVGFLPLSLSLSFPPTVMVEQAEVMLYAALTHIKTWRMARAYMGNAALTGSHTWINSTLWIHLSQQADIALPVMQAIPTDDQMEQIAEKWRPYRSLGAPQHTRCMQ